MTDQQLQRVIAHVEKINPSLTCSFCSARNQFDIDPTLCIVPKFENAGVNLNKARVFVALSCRNCSAVTLLDAVRLGVN